MKETLSKSTSGCSQGKSRRLSTRKATARHRMDSGLRRAITKYRKAAKQAVDSIGPAEEGPFLVAKGISAFAFEQWSSNQDNKWQLFWNRTTQEVWLYGDPSRLHETAASYFTAKLGNLLQLDAFQRVSVEGSPSLNIPAGIKQPDFAFGPLSRDDPSLIGEVAYHNESFPRLVEEEQMWCNADYVQFFVGLKITDRTRAQKTDPKLTLITWRRDTNESKEVEFGCRSRCDSANKVFLEIPVSCLFHQAQIPASLSHQTSISFDLFDLKERCKQKLRNNY